MVLNILAAMAGITSVRNSMKTQDSAAGRFKATVRGTRPAASPEFVSQPSPASPEIVSESPASSSDQRSPASSSDQRSPAAPDPSLAAVETMSVVVRAAVPTATPPEISKEPSQEPIIMETTPQQTQEEKKEKTKEEIKQQLIEARKQQSMEIIKAGFSQFLEHEFCRLTFLKEQMDYQICKMNCDSYSRLTNQIEQDPDFNSDLYKQVPAMDGRSIEDEKAWLREYLKLLKKLNESELRELEGKNPDFRREKKAEFFDRQNYDTDLQWNLIVQKSLLQRVGGTTKELHAQKKGFEKDIFDGSGKINSIG